MLMGLAHLKTSTHHFPEPCFLMLTTSFSFRGHSSGESSWESFWQTLHSFWDGKPLVTPERPPSFTDPSSCRVLALRNSPCFPEEAVGTGPSFIPSFPHSLIHLIFIECLLHVPGTVLGTWNISGNRRQKPCRPQLDIVGVLLISKDKKTDERNFGGKKPSTTKAESHRTAWRFTRNLCRVFKNAGT